MIGELVARLIAAGTDPAIAAQVVAEAFAAGASTCSGGIRVDQTAEKRRAWDREYRRNAKKSPPDSTRIPPDPPENVSSASIYKKESSKLPKEERKETKKERGRASRIPPDWKPLEADLDFARLKGLSVSAIDLQAEKFRNYWSAKSGQAATKMDWAATWRNWILTSIERSGVPPPAPGEDTAALLEQHRKLCMEPRTNVNLPKPEVRRAAGMGQNGTDRSGELRPPDGVVRRDG